MFAGCAETPPLVRIGDKWTGRILTCLKSGPRRFSEIQVPLRNVTPKVLTQSLRALERDGMITRTVFAETPPRVEYALTELGHEAMRLMATCCGWSQQHGAEIHQARLAYAERTDETVAAQAVTSLSA